RRQHRHPHAPERAVVDIHDLDAALLQELRALDQLLDGVAPRRVELDGDDELARLELALEGRGRTLPPEPDGLARGGRAHGDGRSRGLARRGALPVEGLAHRGDVLWRRAAA